MNDFSAALLTAVELIIRLDPDFLEIIVLSFQVSLIGVAIACLLALPLGAAVAISRFRGRMVLVALVNAGMGLPAVVAGLGTYLLLSRTGPFGSLGLLFTPSAMVIAQVVLVAPLITALTMQTMEDLHREYAESLRSFGSGRLRTIRTLLWDGRFSLISAVLAGFGRAIAEVGAVIIVGGNIKHYTRVMTTAIQLETMKGDLPLALALGMVLLALTFLLTLLTQWVRMLASRRYE